MERLDRAMDERESAAILAWLCHYSISWWLDFLHKQINLELQQIQKVREAAIDRYLRLSHQLGSLHSNNCLISHSTDSSILAN